MASERLHIEAVRTFLDRHVSTRRVLIVMTTVGAPAVLVLLTYGDQIAIPKLVTATAAFVITVIAIVLGAMLAITESSSGELASSLLDTRNELRIARDRVKRDKVSREQAAAKAEAQYEQLNSISVLRERLSYLINLALEACHAGGSLSVSRATSLFLDEVGGLAPGLFRLAPAERWSCAIYLLDEEQQILTCVGDVRNASKDEGVGHRPWPVGRGMVGITAFSGRALIVADTATSDLEGMIRDPDERRAAEDRVLYRSVAALPIYKPDGTLSESAEESDPQRPEIYGVVIATSDYANCFQTEDDEEFAPLQALADAVAMVMIAEGLSKKLNGTGGLGNPTDSGEAPRDKRG